MPQAQKSHTLDCASTGMNLPARFMNLQQEGARLSSEEGGRGLPRERENLEPSPPQSIS